MKMSLTFWRSLCGSVKNRTSFLEIYSKKYVTFINIVGIIRSYVYMLYNNGSSKLNF